MKKIFLILTVVAGMAAILSGCKKDEGVRVEAGGGAMEYWSSAKTLVVYMNPTDTTTIPTTLKYEKKANVVLSRNVNDTVELELNYILNGLQNQTFKCEFDGKSVKVDTVSLWKGGRRIYIEGVIEDGVMKLKITDLHAAAFVDKKWMIAGMVDNTEVTKYYGGYTHETHVMPAIRLKCNVDTIYLPGIIFADEDKGIPGSTSSIVRVDSILNTYASYLRCMFAKGDLPSSDDIKMNVAMFDYLEFTKEGKFGLGMDKKHAQTYFNSRGMSDIYDNFDKWCKTYAINGSSLKDFITATDPHCALSYAEGIGKVSGRPVFNISTGVLGSTLISAVNGLLYFMRSTIVVDEETIQIPVHLFEASDSCLVMGLDISALFKCLKKAGQEIEKCSYQQFMNYFPNLNGMFTVLTYEESFRSVEIGKKGEKKTIGEYMDEIGLNDFQLTEGMYNAVKPFISSLLIAFGDAFSGVEMTLEVEFTPYQETSVRDWEYVPTI